MLAYMKVPAEARALASLSTSCAHRCISRVMTAPPPLQRQKRHFDQILLLFPLEDVCGTLEYATETLYVANTYSKPIHTPPAAHLISNPQSTDGPFPLRAVRACSWRMCALTAQPAGSSRRTCTQALPGWATSWRADGAQSSA